MPDRSPAGTRTLVLGGGGVTGIAWEVGVIAGLAALGVDLRAADTVIGTSAGSVVGAQLTSGQTPETLFDRQLRGYGPERAGELGWRVRLGFARALLGPSAGFARRLAGRALKARVMPEQERLEVIEARLPRHDWPDADLRVTVVDAASGEFRVLTRSDGVPLVTAVAASCAVPLVYPPVTVGDRRYVDGGVRSVANADLAAGARGVVVLAPSVRGIGPMAAVTDQVEQLRAGGALVALVTPDAAAVAAIGRNVLDPANRPGAARAGRAQAATALSALGAVWAP